MDTRPHLLFAAAVGLWSAKEMRRIDELCQNLQRSKKTDDPAWAHLAITTAAWKVSGIHADALKIICSDICTCFINMNKHEPTPHGILLFLSLRSNAPKIGFDLDDSPGRREVSEPHRPTVGKFNAWPSQSYPVKYHFKKAQTSAGNVALFWQYSSYQRVTGAVSDWASETTQTPTRPRGRYSWN